MERLTFEDVKRMTFEELEAIDDPVDLAHIGALSPLLVRYVVRTGQLHLRYDGVALPALLEAINKAVPVTRLPPEVWRKIPFATRDDDVDAYLDRLQANVSGALRPH
ncbi:hypothetical protein [Pandoraea sputorum]|uniref:Uncharacterized protein n=1 Tax=Pandoraea sputorum TaxID=93222 RepID=A0A5E5BGQ9_9BURK|nr:hypothetical protein [Pandoraea sputorum]VVE84457.1 hypothetical protein PSP31121_04772 [Pandoraea sputorum]